MILDTDDEASPMAVKPNIELGFIGRNNINDAVDPDEYKKITKGEFSGDFNLCELFTPINLQTMR